MKNSKFFKPGKRSANSAFQNDRSQTGRSQSGNSRKSSKQRSGHQPLPSEPRNLTIINLDHQGRGIAKHEGKTQFISGALPGEVVEARITKVLSKYDEGVSIAISSPSNDRELPFCQHFKTCGGCSLQHLSIVGQRQSKETRLRELLGRAGVEVAQWLPILAADDQGYRRRAKLGVRYRKQLDQVIVGFREEGSQHLTEVSTCPVLVPEIQKVASQLQPLISELNGKDRITQADLVSAKQGVVLVLRAIKPLSQQDLDRLNDFAEQKTIKLGLIQGQKEDGLEIEWVGVKSIDVAQSSYDLAVNNHRVEIRFEPMDFIQVNAEINQKMVEQALAWLDIDGSVHSEMNNSQLNSQLKVLDLFSGLGNFSLPLAKQGIQVIGVEGDQNMVARANANAEQNGLANARFVKANLASDWENRDWAQAAYDGILLDPPRAGAKEIVEKIGRLHAPDKKGNPTRRPVPKVLYVSCDPATLARDAKILQDAGYRAKKAGVMDMFPHTAHVESMMLFEYKK